MNSSIFETTADDIYDQFCYLEEEENEEDDHRAEDRMDQMINKYGY